jgi:hypothetical protein
MIENRFRIEKQILLGRQAARTIAERARSRANPGNARNLVIDGHVVPEPITGTQLPTTLVRFESPIPMDSDTERAFEDDVTARYFRRIRSTVSTPRDSGTNTPYENGYNDVTDPLRSPVLRRRWASDLLDAVGGSSSASPRPATPEAPVDDPRRNPSRYMPSTKVGPGSLSALSIPLSGSHRRSRSNGEGLSVGASEMVWSGESSSEDDSDYLEPRLDPNTDFNQEAISDGEGIDSD